MDTTMSLSSLATALRNLSKKATPSRQARDGPKCEEAHTVDSTRGFVVVVVDQAESLIDLTQEREPSLELPLPLRPCSPWACQTRLQDQCHCRPRSARC